MRAARTRRRRRSRGALGRRASRTRSLPRDVPPRLAALGLRPHVHRHVPPNDGGLCPRPARGRRRLDALEGPDPCASVSQVASSRLRYEDGVCMGRVDFGGVAKQRVPRARARRRSRATTCSSTSASRSRKLDEAEAQRVFELLAELGQLDGVEPGREVPRRVSRTRRGHARCARRDRARSRRTPLGRDGGVRRPDPRDRPLRPRPHAAAVRRARARPGLSGVRDAARDDRPRPRHRVTPRASSSAPSATCCACPGSRGDLSRCALAAPTCASSTRRSTRSRSRGESRRAQVVFFAIGFETTAPANAMAVALARRRDRSRTSPRWSRTCSCRPR